MPNRYGHLAPPTAAATARHPDHIASHWFNSCCELCLVDLYGVRFADRR